MTSEQTPLRIGLVVEGPTDYQMLMAVIGKLLQPRPLLFSYLQPEYSEGFTPIGSEAGGWPGVYRWCRNTSELNGPAGLADNFLFLNHDIVILQLDADVAGFDYSSGHIANPPHDDLPCTQPCPPVTPTVEALESVLLGWLNASQCPRQLVLCLPAQSLETWVLAGLYPEDSLLRQANLECRPNTERRLASKPLKGRLVSGSKKLLNEYQRRAPELADSWSQVTAICSQAARFEASLLAAT
jgi:hypothetical protein